MVANFKITAWGVVEVPATRVYPDHPLMRRDRRVSERGNVVNGRVVRTTAFKLGDGLGILDLPNYKISIWIRILSQIADSDPLP